MKLKMKMDMKRLTVCAVLTSLALVMSLAESLFPVPLLIPVPGIKPGLANVVTVFAIYMLSPMETILIILLRCLVTGLFTGPVPFLFSLTGALLAYGMMQLLYLGQERWFSPAGISIGGAVMHNAGQVAVASFLMKDTGLFFSYLPALMLVAVFTGALTGIAAGQVIKILKTNLNNYGKN